MLLTSKDSSDKRLKIESAFRYYKEAFFELSTVYLCALEEIKKSDSISSDTIKGMISRAISQLENELFRGSSSRMNANSPRSYAAVAGSTTTPVVEKVGARLLWSKNQLSGGT